jgi:hypothetical protein
MQSSRSNSNDLLLRLDCYFLRKVSCDEWVNAVTDQLVI